MSRSGILASKVRVNHLPPHNILWCILHLEIMQSSILYALPVHSFRGARARVIDDLTISQQAFSTPNPIRVIMVLLAACLPVNC